MATAALSKAYRNEKDADLRERILLVRLVREDKKEASMLLKRNSINLEWWAYKWLERFDNAGLNGLKNKHRSGRPPEVSEEATAKIRKELSENQSGWMAKEVMNLIYMKEQESSIMKFISTDYYIDGVSVLRYQK